MSAPASLGPPLFVVGALRSGTTLLRVMLDRHPLLAIPPESHFVPVLWARRRRYGRNGRIEDRERFLHDLAADSRFRGWELPLDAVRRELALHQSPTFGQAIDAVFRAYASREGKRRWADKTPRYVDCLPLLARIVPEARFVHLIRDGRDVAISIVDLGRLHRRSATAAFFWARRVTNGRRAGVALGPKRYTEMRYEDLLDDLEGGLRRLCAFADLPFDPVMLEHDERAIQRVPARQRRMHARLALPPTKGLRDWRTQMPADELAEFEAIAGAVLVDVGYELASGPVGVGTRLRAWSRMLGLGTRVAGYRMRALARRVRRRMAANQRS